MIPAEALATARDEIIVLDAEENVEEVTIEDDVYESNDGLEVIEGDVDIPEPGDDSDEQTLVTDDVIEDPAIVVQNTASEQPAFENKIADVNDSEGALPGDLSSIAASGQTDPKWQDSADYDLDDNVPYRLSATLPEDITSYRFYHLTFTDQMEESLKFNADSVRVFVGKTELKGQDAFELTPNAAGTDGHDFKLTIRWAGESGERIADESLKGAKVQVFFTAQLTGPSVNYGDEGNINGAKLNYSHNVNAKSAAEDEKNDDETHNEHETDWDYVIAFTYKMEVNKRWVNADGDEVDPAQVEFKLEKVLADNSRVAVAVDEDSCETAENEAGEQVTTTFAFKGLDDGDYVLTETAPEGFRGAGEIRFEVKAEHDVVWDKTSDAKNTDGESLDADFPTDRADDLTLNGDVTSGEITFTPDATDDDGNACLSAEVKNLEIGNLKVTKTVAGVANQEDTEFQVYVLNDKDEYLYHDEEGKVAYDAQKHANLVSNANPLLLEGIPTGGYRVTEEEPGDISEGDATYKFIGVSGEVENPGTEDGDDGYVTRGQTTTVALTNTYTVPEKGALLIHKRVAGGRDFIDEMDKLVRFTVTAADGKVVASRLLGEFDEKIAMPDGDSGIRVWTLTGLEVGDYTVTESRDDADSDNPTGINYEAYGLETGSSANVTITAEKVTEIRPSNVYNEAAGIAKLRATKTVAGSEQKDKDEAFTFDVALVEKALDDPYAEVKPEDVLPADPTITAKAGETGETANIFYSQTGSYYYAITERVPTDPTPGMTYDGAAHYARVVVHDDCTTSVAYGDDLDDLKAMTQQQVREAAGQAASATVTNRYELGSLRVSKELLGAPDDAADQDFDVVVTSNTTGKFVAADGALSDEEQILNVSKNTPLEIHDIPVGSYTVTELESNRGIDLYTFLEDGSTTDATAEVTYNGTAEVTLTNVYEKNGVSAQIRVGKVVRTADGSKYEDDEDFTFKLAPVTEDAPMPASDTIAVKAGKRVSFGKITFDDEGEYLYSITEVKGRTPGMTYNSKPYYALVTVEEGEDSLVAEVTYGATQKTADEDESLTITNTYGSTADLQVKKTVLSTRAADKQKAFKFKITLYNDNAYQTVKRLSGTYGDVSFANGVAEVSLKDGQTKTAKGLPPGTCYKVVETDAGGLSSSMRETKTSSGALVTCTNTYRTTTPSRSTSGTHRNIKLATVSNIPDQVYSGKALRPKPTVTMGKVKLTENVDYVLEYFNNISVGTAVVTLTGIDSYDSVKVCTFNIRKAPNTLAIKVKKKSVKRSAVQNKARAVAPLKVTGGVGTITYRKVTKGSSSRLTVNKKTGKVTVKKGTKKGTYTIKVKVTAAGDANHLSASKVVKAKVVVK